jgi:hypothetical protein
VAGGPPLRRGLGLQDVGLQVFIDRNGPGNGEKWHYVTIVKSGDYEITRRLKSLDVKLPFF